MSGVCRTRLKPRASECSEKYAVHVQRQVNGGYGKSLVLNNIFLKYDLDPVFLAVQQTKK